MQDIEDRVFAGNDRSVTKSNAEQSIILPSFITILLVNQRIQNWKHKECLVFYIV
jgi:hypothetical protein